MKQFILILTLFSVVFISCDSDDDGQPNPPIENTGTLTLKFNFKVGDDDLDLSNSTHVLSGDDTVVFNQFKFILSNINLSGAGNSDWLNEEGYYLVKADPGSQTFALNIEEVPAGTYSELRFFIGMDSAMNFKPDDFPILFQQEGMYWDWNTGYKFLLLEGDYFSTSLGTPGNKLPFVAHIGDMINLETPSFQFNTELEIENGNTTEIDFIIDLEKIYVAPNRLNLDDLNNRNIMGGPKASLVSENYGNGMIQLMQ